MMKDKISVTIKKMKQEDLDEVLKIEEQAYPNHHWSKNSFCQELTNKLAHYYCVFDAQNGNLAAYIGYWEIFEEAHITTLAVSPEYRNRQLAEILLITMFNDCYKQMIKYVTLEVRESNIPAISLYEKYGFTSIGQRKHYYQDNNENALIMFTENIWHDKFKTLYNTNINNITKVNYYYDEKN